MERTELTTEQHETLCGRIFNILAELGPSQTTMDLLARRLSISKRTLYEIFGSKDDMLRSILDRIDRQYAAEVERIIRESNNVMEVMANVFIYHKHSMTRLSAAFFRDMDTRYRHLRNNYENNSHKWVKYVNRALRLGVRQGVFRSDVNYDLTIPLMRVQMESLKRMEEFFPLGITLVDAYNAIALGTLRSIASPKGMKILDTLTSKFT